MTTPRGTTGTGRPAGGVRPSPVAGGAGELATSVGPSGVARQFAETFVPEHPAAAGARARAEQVGVTPVSPGVAATLTFLGSLLGARAAVEIGTGTGVSALGLLGGLGSGGVLTSVDVDGEQVRLARATMAEAGIAPTRARLINGRALDVLPRLTDGAYDLVFADADPLEADAYLDAALRLLRPGGVFAVDDALAGDGVADPARRDPATSAARALGTRVLEDERLTPLLLPVGGGLLLATVAR